MAGKDASDATHSNGVKSRTELPVIGQDSVESRADENVRARIQKAAGAPELWRSLDDLADDPEFRDLVEHEFPAGSDQMLDPVTRRSFMKVMGASLALAGVSSCVNQPEEKIVPYVKQPEQLVPGKPLYYATTVSLAGYGTGVLVETHEGRPTRVEGNPDHPASLGSADIFSQAEILQMYDPDRLRAVRHKGDVSSWTALSGFVEKKLATMPDGRGIAMLLGAVGSPTTRAQIEKLRRTYPEIGLYHYESAPVGSGNTLLRFDFSKADVVVSLGCDFLTTLPGSLAYAKEFGERRNPEEAADAHNRLYVAESSPTPTGSVADHRLASRTVELASIASAIASAIGAPSGAPSDTLSDNAKAFVAAAASDLKKAGSGGLVLTDPRMPVGVRSIVDGINAALGAVGSTVRSTTAPIPAADDPTADLRRLVAEITAGNVNTIVVSGCNPLYDAPADIDFSTAFSSVPHRISLGLFEDETSRMAHWSVPETHPFETWSDAVAFDGTASLVQPMIAPLYDDTKSLAQLVSLVLGDVVAKDRDLVEAYWSSRLPGNFEKAWRKGLHDGLLPVPAGPVSSSSASTGDASSTTDAGPVAGEASGRAPTMPSDEGGVEINFRTDPTIFDGRYNNNGWLQELPKPMTKLVWDNAVLMSPSMADSLSVENGDIVKVARGKHETEGPVWITPGHADGSVTMYLGYGRQITGRVGEGAGFSVAPLRTSDAFWTGTGASVTPTGEDYELVSTQNHWSLEGRNYYRQVTLAEFLGDPKAVSSFDHIENDGSLSFYGSADWSYDGYAWGMTIDLNRCSSCNACVIACQSENNIAVVGKDQVAVGREMHWIRVDRYFGGDPNTTNSVEIYAQPVPCMQCEQAPCEVVCPVAATVHSAEGLNDMVYNRCVGTRYCSNNCPYKVRRFNFLQYTNETTEQFRLMRNPDVSVRTRGVMEKCTYCVQRINHARIESKIADVGIPVDSVVTACQSACPTNAIAFGDQSNPESRVAKLKSSTRNFGMLAAELNTRPRTTYLARLRNAHPSLEPESPQGDAHH